MTSNSPTRKNVKLTGYLLSDIASLPITCSDSVTATHDYETLRSTQDNCVPQGISVVRGLVSEKFSVRVLARLAEAEQKTEVATEQQDYRIAWLTVLRADEGNPEPWRTAFWEIVGNTPEKAIPYWLCRDDLLQDEHVPLPMLELRYTRDWGSDYVRAKMAAEAARAAGLPPKKPVEFDPLHFPSEKRNPRRSEQGFSSWLPIACCTLFVIALTLWLARGTRHTYFYSYPTSYLRIVQNIDLEHGSFVVQPVSTVMGKEVVGPESEMHFRGHIPQFEAGMTLRWIRFDDFGSYQSVAAEDHGYDVLREDKPTFVNGQWHRMPILAPNCRPDWVHDHIVCEGGKAEWK
jgi:hypothetical protein